VLKRTTVFGNKKGKPLGKR